MKGRIRPIRRWRPRARREFVAVCLPFAQPYWALVPALARLRSAAAREHGLVFRT